MLDLMVQARHLIDLALDEDLGEDGDISSDAVFGQETGRSRVKARQGGVIFGIFLVEEICKKVDDELVVTSLVRDGDRVQIDDILLYLDGPITSILRSERTILNFLGFLSGIATTSADFADVARAHGTTTILDTRKTLPGWRLLSKAAVLAGGSSNHRMGLYDMVMLKDNHIDAAGSMTAAVQRVRDRYGSQFRIEVECRSLGDVEEALSLGVDVAMLDNMDLEACKEAVALRARFQPAGPTHFEASGDMDLGKVARFAAIGLEYISVGGLTHSVTNFNLSMGFVAGGIL